MANEKENLQIKKKPQEVSDDELNAIAGGLPTSSPCNPSVESSNELDYNNSCSCNH